MRVALSVSVVQRGKSGVATYVFGLLQGFAKMDSPPEVHLFGLEEDRELFDAWSEFCEWHPIAEVYRPAVRNILWHQVIFPGLLKKLSPDLLHIPSYRRILAVCPCPQMVTIHDMPFHLGNKYDPMRMFYGRVVVPQLALRADRILTVSYATASDVERFCEINRNNIQVVWNGIRHDLFVPPAKSQSRLMETKLGVTAPYFIYLARLEHPAKNHVRLIEAFEIFTQNNQDREYHLVFGGADWHGAEVIHERVSRSPLQKNIHSLGFVAQDELPLWYGQAEALVYPSLFEGFGLPPIEAMATGCPVVSSDRGSLKEVIGDAALVVDPYDLNGMAAALTEVSQWETDRREKIISEGILHAAQFSWERCALQTVSLYQNLNG